MTEPEYFEIEFTRWECDKTNLSGTCAELQPVLRVQSVLDPCTQQKIGLYFQHRINLSSNEGTILNCTAEHVFISAEIFLYSFCQLKQLIESAHERFKIKLLERTTAEKIPVNLDCFVNDFEVEQLMQQLK